MTGTTAPIPAPEERAEDSGQAAGLPGDYHVHTTFSDGEGSVEECVAQAVSAGLAEIGIADHFSPVEQTEWNLPHARVGDYALEIREVARRHDDVTVLLGLEADYVPEHEAQLRAFLAEHHFDYVIGGVHEVNGFEFDDPDQRDGPCFRIPTRSSAATTRSCAARPGAAASTSSPTSTGSASGPPPGPAASDAIDAALEARSLRRAAPSSSTRTR